MNSIRWIWTLVKQQKWGYALGFLFILMEIAAKLSQVGLQKFIIDDVFIRGQYIKLPLLLTLFGVAVLASFNLFTLVAMVHHYIGYRLRITLSERLMRQICSLPMEVFHKERAAKYVNYFMGDIYNIGQHISYEIPLGIQKMVMALSLIVIVGLASPVILAIVLLFACGYILLGKYFSSKLRRASKEVQDRKSDMLVHLEEGISATREVVAYNRMDWEAARYRQLFKTFYDRIMIQGRLANKQLLLSQPVRWGSNLTVLFYGGYCVIEGSLSIGLFVVTYQYASQLVGSLQSVYQFVLSLSGMMAHVDRVKSIMEGKTIEHGTVSLEGPIRTIQFDRVNFRYSDDTQPVLRDLSLDLPLGKKIAIVGPSGGGKSTVTRLLIRYFESTEGQIWVNGQPLQSINSDQWMNRLAVVFQEPYLFPDTVRNNLVFGREHITDSELYKICQLMQIHDTILSLPEGYDTELGERGITLSGGERQRLALARAMLADAEILILDEATSALDLETERMVIQNLDKLRSGKTTIIIAHRLSTIQNANIIYVMEEGRIIEHGTHEQLMLAGEIYKKLISAQKEDYELITNE